MIERRSPDHTPDERALDISAITLAMRLGIRESLWMHKRLGHPVAVWEDGSVRWVPPEEIPGPESPFWADVDRE